MGGGFRVDVEDPRYLTALGRMREAEVWDRIEDCLAAATDVLNADLATAKRAGVAPGSGEANVLAERHRALMSRYVDCTHSMQACMGRTYVDEPGYAYEAVAPGLTGRLRDVILANAEAHGVDPESARWE